MGAWPEPDEATAWNCKPVCGACARTNEAGGCIYRDVF